MKSFYIIIASLLLTHCANQEVKELQDIVFGDDADVKIKKTAIKKRKTKKKLRISARNQKNTLSDIITYINQDKLLEAEGLLNSALKSNSFQAYKSDLYFLKSSILVISHLEQKALVFLKKGLRIDPRNIEARDLYQRITGDTYQTTQKAIVKLDKKNPESLAITPLGNLLSRIQSNDFNTDGDFHFNIDSQNKKPAIVETLRPQNTLELVKKPNHSDPLFANEEKQPTKNYASLVKPIKKQVVKRVHKIKKKKRFHLKKQNNIIETSKVNKKFKPSFNNSVIIIDETELD